METSIQRRRFLGRLAAVMGGLVALPALATPALARSRRRFYGGGWGGYPYNRRSISRRRYWGPGYGGGYYGGGYYGGGYRGGYAAPGYYAPPRIIVQPPPVYYGPGGGYYPPFSRIDTPARDALALLEA